MAITLKKKPEIDLYGTRWLHLKLDEQGHLSPCDVEAGATFRCWWGRLAIRFSSPTTR
ncbi:hypothetical protein ACET33_18740 [Pseudomonas aeruginosa]